MRSLIPALVALGLAGGAAAQDSETEPSPEEQMTEFTAGIAELDVHMARLATDLGIAFQPVSPILLPLVGPIVGQEPVAGEDRFDVAFNFRYQPFAEDGPPEGFWPVYADAQACAEAHGGYRVVRFERLAPERGLGHRCIVAGPDLEGEGWILLSDATVRTGDRQINVSSMGFALSKDLTVAEAAVGQRTPLLTTIALAFEDRVFVTFLPTPTGDAP